MSELFPLPPPPRPVFDVRYFYFLLLFALSLVALGHLLLPFVPILVLSLLLANLFRPVYLLLRRWCSPSFSSLLTCFLIVALVFFPLFFFTRSLTQEALAVYNWGRDSQLLQKLQPFLQNNELLNRLMVYLDNVGLSIKPSDIVDFITYLAKTAGLFLYNQASSWAANILQMVVQFVMMILVIFFLLIDIPRLVEYIVRLSPLPDEEDHLLLSKSAAIANAILVGNGICGLVQGVVGGIIYSVMELSSPVLWGCVMAVLAFLPIFGIGLVMIPTALLLLLNGRVGEGVLLLFLYMGLSFSMEYLVKPKLVGTQVRMHTLLVFLSIIGGLAVYGFMGIFYGPLIITAFLTLSELYMTNYVGRQKAASSGPSTAMNEQEAGSP